jgi:hypothetical protein
MSTSLGQVLARLRLAFHVTSEGGADVSQRPSLIKDDRGVIMIVGVFFTFLWIGLVWFILGLGTAINYHENLQNAADAAAFAAAVYDAQGMNILAMINVIMGVALSALVIAHIIQLIAFGALLLGDCASCMGSLTCGYGWVDCPSDCGDMGDVNKGVKDVDTAVHDILKVCHDVEVAIAVGWPWVAAGKSTTLVPPTPLVPLTTSFSYSQVPSAGDIKVVTGLDFTAVSDNPARLGLPVMSDSYKDLCTVATLDVGDLYGLIPAGVGSIIGGALNIAGNWLCDAGQDSSIPTDIIEYAIGLPWSITCCTYAECGLFPTALPGDMKDVGADNHSQSPMKMIKTRMGTDYFGVWSTAVGNYSDHLTPKRVAIAGLESKTGSKVVADLPDDVDMGVTRAEFYYDPRPGDSVSTETTISSGDQLPIRDVMWNMRWRARLRRYHNFPDGLGAEALEAALSAVGGGPAEAAVAALISGGGLVGLEPETVQVNKENNPPAKNIYH